ncbi:phosphoadenylyl-sulfate reductase [Litchfieldia alkalitelluris]|uniref:phosphoadenylyl-sulfate reductase n=1 Tax=Litchfieldia alkalitelluris TaxID=304268 RepID=UPI000997A6AB|nr:phosphoadenylyl-sulfate reductase [Litchfieldia alkalitelluris]
MNELLTYENWKQDDADDINHKIKDYFEMLKWAYSTYPKYDIVYACSFGAEGMVLIDLIYKVKKDAKIVFLDTGVHFKETYELIDKVKENYPLLDIQLKKPGLSLDEQRDRYGDELWKVNPNLCCQLRKIEPLKEVLGEAKAWISGLRRDQSHTRKHLEFINKDDKFGLVKICPLIHWSWDDVWTYIKLNNLPYNELHDKNYPSIGCEPCTQPSLSNDLRSGRWANHEKTECGLHLDK